MAIEKALRWVVLGGIFALPFIVFIVAQSLFFPFITGKNFTFRIIVEVITGAWLALALVNPDFRPKRSWLLGAFAFFIAVVALADAFGAYPFKSFWSNFERMDGWVTLAHLFCYFVVASSVLNTEKLWRAFWHTTLAVSVIVGFYGVLQLVGVASLNPGFSSASRIDATFGNPIYLAVYMLFHIGIASLLWVRTREEYPGVRGWLPILYGGVIAFDALVVFLTGTRGAMLGLFGGVVLGALLMALTSMSARRYALAVVGGFMLFASGFWFVRDAAWISYIPFLERLATISLEDKTTQARFMNWGMAWEGVKERPVLGWGQENYAVVFDKYYNPDMYGQEPWFDRVHNIIFDWLVAAGFVGLLSYLSLFACALWIVWKGSGFSTSERSVITGTLAAYFFHNLFVFDNVSSYLLFVSILAFIAWRGSQNAAAIPMPRFSHRLLPVVAFGAVVLVWGSAWYVSARPLAANHALLDALRPQGNLEVNLEHFKQSIAYDTIGVQEAREQLAQAAMQMARAEQVPVSVKQKFFDAAVQEMVKMTEEAPLNARAPLFLGILLNTYGDYENAIRVLERAHELSPNKQAILFELASSRYASGAIEESLATYKEAFDLAPEYLDARLYYAAAAIRSNQPALAEEILAPAVVSGDAADARIAAAYVSQNRFDKIVEIWQARIQAHPNDASAYLTLAAAYDGLGNSTRAIAVLEELKLNVLEVESQADELIEQIRRGESLR